MSKITNLKYNMKSLRKLIKEYAKMNGLEKVPPKHIEESLGFRIFVLSSRTNELWNEILKSLKLK